MLFETISDKFFNPFCCQNKEIYFDCISQLIEKSKELPLLYETDAKNCMILYLQNCRYSIETENIGEEVSNGRTPQENAASILRYFRACGWIAAQEVGRTGDNIAAISPYCRKLIDAIHKIFDSNANSTITNYIFSMYEILKAAFEKDSARAIRPYSNILVPLIEHECDFKNELLILKDSIREIMRAVMKMTDTNSFGQFLIKDELLNRFFKDYFFIKKSGLIPAYISNIDKLLVRLRRSNVYKRIVQEYMALFQKDEYSVKERIDRQFDELENFINIEYDREIGYIDKKINTYYNLYATRMMMVLSNSTNLEHQLNQLLLYLKALSDADRQAALDRLSQAHRLQSIKYIGRKSFAQRRKVNPHTERTGIPAQELSLEDKKRLTDELLAAVPDTYNLDNVKSYLDHLCRGKALFSVEECRVHTRSDAMMIAASMIYSGTTGFPYEVEFQDGLIETEVAKISNIKIKRK